MQILLNALHTKGVISWDDSDEDKENKRKNTRLTDEILFKNGYTYDQKNACLVNNIYNHKINIDDLRNRVMLVGELEYMINVWNPNGRPEQPFKIKIKID